jgi:hypothetical protein
MILYSQFQNPLNFGKGLRVHYPISLFSNAVLAEDEKPELRDIQCNYASIRLTSEGHLGSIATSNTSSQHGPGTCTQSKLPNHTKDAPYHANDDYIA